MTLLTILAGGVLVGVVLCYAYTPLHTLLLRMGIVPSYTERVYSVGTGEPHTTYVPLGDSLTAGVGAGSYQNSYPYLLATRLSERGGQVTLKPHAKPGATTNEAVTKLLDGVIASDPDLVTVLLGVNDVYRGVSAEAFTYTYRYILERLTHETRARVYVVAIPYVGAPGLTTPADHAYLDARTQAFNAILRTLAETYHLPYLDLYTPTAAQAYAEGGDYYAKDLLHPSATGYALWADILYAHLN